MSDTDTTTAPPTPPPRLTRDPERGQWLGVAAGLGRYFGIDPVIPRIAFVILTLTGGFGIILYLLLWLAMPLPGSDATPSENATAQLRDVPTWLSVTIIVLGLVWVGGILGSSAPGLMWGLALVGLGVLLFQQDSRQQTEAATTTVPPPPHPAAAAAGAPSPRRSSPASAPAPAQPPPSEPPSVLGRLTVAVLLLVIGGAALYPNTVGTVLGLRTYLALGLIVVGGGLAVGAWWGRARWLIPLGVVLVLVALATGIRGLPAVAGGVGERHWEPRTLAELGEQEFDYRLLAGEGVVDLSQVDAALWGGRVTGNIVFGELTVVVPDDMDVAVLASVIAGQIDVFDTTDAGFLLDVRRGTSTADADLVLDLRGAFGQLTVVRAAPDDQGPRETGQSPAAGRSR